MSHKIGIRKTPVEIREATERLIQAQRNSYAHWLAIHYPKVALGSEPETSCQGDSERSNFEDVEVPFCIDC